MQAGVLVARVALDVEMPIGDGLERLLRGGASAGGAEAGEGVAAGDTGERERDDGGESRGDSGASRGAGQGTAVRRDEQGGVRRYRRG